MDKLIALDKSLFLVLNSLHADWSDPIMIAFSERVTWVPFYLILLVFLYKKYDVKSVGIIALLVVGLITAADQISVHLFKNVFERLRPCHNEEIKSSIYLLKGCGGQYGFVSSHASNTFALAFFVGMLLSKKWLLGLLAWAAIVSYSRIYLGVHYPGDIFGGALLGIIIASAFLYVGKKLNLKTKSDE